MRASDDHVARMREEVIAAASALSAELGAPPATPERARAS
jgi:hypothetical protein